MKIIVIELNGASPELLFGDEMLENVRRLMEIGCHGVLEPVTPSVEPSKVWDQVARKAKRPFVVGMYPEDLIAAEGDDSLFTPDRAAIRDKIFAETHARFEVVRDSLRGNDWDYLQVIETGIDLIRLGFMKRPNEPDSLFHETIRDYCRLFDRELGMVLETLTDDTVILVASAHGVVEDLCETHQGAFLLASANSPLQGSIEGAKWVDLAPTLLELGGFDVSEPMEGRSLVVRLAARFEAGDISSIEEELVRERLRGLGYIA